MRRRLALALACALLFCLSSALADGAELIANGGFESVDADGAPEGWFSKAYRNQVGYSRIAVTDKLAHSGARSAVIENASMNDARYIFTAAVQPNSLYRLSAYVLADGIASSGNGANLAIEDIYSFSEKLYDTGGEWRYVEWYGETGSDQRQLTLGVRLGGYGAESTGKAYFDDVSLVKVDSLPEDVSASVWYKLQSASAASSEPQKSTALFILLAIAFAVLCALMRGYLACKPDLRRDRRAVVVFWCVMAVGLALRLALSAKVAGYQVDINCFTAWSLRMAELGPSGFYAEGYFCDYPPGYMLLLWPCGLLLKAVGYGGTPLALIVVKSVPVICDMLGALLIYAFAKKRLSNTAAVTLSALYLLNPAVLVNGAAWGQADSVLALFITVTAVLAMRKNWRAAIPMFFVSALIKPQALLFAPVGGIWLIVCLARNKQTRKLELREALIGLGISLAAAVAIVLPFSLKQARPVGWLIELYGKTLSSYAYATLNTANLFYLTGANWVSIESLVPTYLTIIAAIVLAAFGGLLLYLARRGAVDGESGSDTDGGDDVDASINADRNARKPPKPQSSLKQQTKQEPHILATRRWYLGKKALCGFTSLAFAAFMLVLCFTGASYGLFGYAMMGYSFALAIACLITDHRPETLPLYMALALIGVYVAGVKIHERYLFPALILLLIGYASTRDRRALVTMLGFSITTFINTAVVLDNSILYGSSMGHLNPDTMTLNIMLCVINLALMGYTVYSAVFPPRKPRADCLSEDSQGSTSANEQNAEVAATGGHEIPPAYADMLLSPRDACMRLTLRDYLIMGVTAVLYGVLTLSTLGSTVAPQDGWISTDASEQIVFELDEPAEFKFLYYAGVSYNSFSIAVSDDGVVWSTDYPCEMKEGLCYTWRYALQSDYMDGKVQYASNDPNGVLWLQGKYLRLDANQAGLNLFEIALRDENGDNLPLKVVSHTGANLDLLGEAKPAENLINEQYTCVGEPSWYNGMYFDEIYHARTAYEHLHNQVPYESTHPPLGKLLMSGAIAIFGMTPFGWRFAGAFIGILMLPAIYLLAMQLFKKRGAATVAMLAFTFDLMHFAQTRIATIDSFPVFFIILSYLCMARYMQTDTFAVAEGEKPALFTRAYLRSLIPLALCGLFMGLSIASKWIGLYSAVGLALLYFGAIYRQFRAGLAAFAYDTQSGALSDNQKLRVRVAQDYALKRAFITCGFCVVFFILVPCLIYYLCYIPYFKPTGGITIQRVIEVQQGMLRYHSTPGLGMDHPFQSPWWQWPFLMKPIWFNQDKFEPTGFASTIESMGNPWIYYIGAFCMLAALVASVAKYVRFKGGVRLKHGDGDMTLAVLAIGFLAQYLPWILVPRSMYMYHYFASVPFVILSTVWALERIPNRNIRVGVCIGYTVVGAAFFAAFFPYASGVLAPVEWLQAVKEFFAWPSGLADGLKYLFRIYY